MAYCDKYLVKNGELESGTRIDMHTRSTLQLIQQYTVSLLTIGSLKQIMPYVMGSAQEYNSLLKLMMNRIYQGKVPNYFANILKLFYEWRYLRWVTSKKTEPIERILRYHFFNTLVPKKPYLLYECWVFYKILDIMVDNFKVKFRESGKSGTTFVSDDGSIKVTYQKRYKAKWLKKGQEMYEYPDIIIEFKNGLTLVVDAKDAEYISGCYRYRRQIDDYVEYAKAKFGVLIFSRGNEELRDDLLTAEENNASWTTLTPSPTGDKDDTNNKNLQKLMQQGINCYNTRV